MLRLETRKSGTTEVREVVETKDGDLDWLISVNGEPLPEDQRRERGRGLQRLISNPAELKKSKRETDEDQARSQRLLKMLPDALVFEYGEQRGDLVELKFKPNSHFRPPSHEAAVVHAMEGVLRVNGRQKRLVEISGHLTRPVKFGGGLLGHLDAGGHFYVKQEEVQLVDGLPAIVVGAGVPEQLSGLCCSGSVTPVRAISHGRYRWDCV